MYETAQQERTSRAALCLHPKSCLGAAPGRGKRIWDQMHRPLLFFARLFSFFYMKSARIEDFVSGKAFVSGR